jgi:hypothetical protein
MLFARLLPWGLEELLARAVGERIPREGAGGQYAIAAVGRFRGRLIGDVLSWVGNQGMDGALVLAEPDVVRCLYAHQGRIVGADSDLVFERLGRVLCQAGSLSTEAADALVDVEERQGLAAAAARLPKATARQGIERRTKAIASALFLVPNAHFVLVEGRPFLDDLPRVDLGTTELAVEGLRRYDEWRSLTA